MIILSVRRGFLADHSSTSYEFLAIDTPLDAEARAAVASLSSRANPTSRRVSFVYHADGYDIPGGWEALMLQHYDVMCSESYDWWTLAVAFDTTDQSLVERLKRYEFRDVNELGISIIHRNARVVVIIDCRLAAGMLAGFEENDGFWGGEGFDEDEEDLTDAGVAAIDDSLLDLLARVRSCLMRGELEPLHAVWEEYGSDSDGTIAPPRPEETAAGATVAAELAAILDTVL